MAHDLPPPQTPEFVDISQPFPLFEGASVIEIDDRSLLDVPTRYVRTERYGDWSLNVRGESKWFKEHDDYGQIRFAQSGKIFWIPHVYPFEPTDSHTDMPVIVDRERLEVWIEMEQQAESKETPALNFELHLDTDYGHCASVPEEGAYYGSNPYGSFLRFDTFFYENMPLYVQDVQIATHERGISAEDYLMNVYRKSGDTAMDEAMRGPMPDHVGLKHSYNHHSERESFISDNHHFGALWVPVADIRGGTLRADVTFPMFLGKK